MARFGELRTPLSQNALNENVSLERGMLNGFDCGESFSLALGQSSTTVLYLLIDRTWYNITRVCMYVCMVITYSKGKDQPGEVDNPARDQHFLCPRSRLRIWSREMGSAVPSRVRLLISILRLNLVLTYGIPPEFRGGVQLFI